MTLHSTATRYAQAAFELAQEGKERSAWQESLSRLADLLDNQDLRDFLDAPLIPDPEKHAALQALAPDAPRLVHNLVGVLLRNGLVSLLPLVAQEFQRLVDQQDGVERATVTTAIPVDDDVVEAIRQRLEELTGNKVDVAVDVSPSILGGFVARVGDRLIDGSTRTRFKQLRGKMVAGR